jgi:hypothetical protein
MIELMNKLIEETRENNQFLRRFLDTSDRKDISTTQSYVHNRGSSQAMRKNLTGLVFYPQRHMDNILTPLKTHHGSLQP